MALSKDHSQTILYNSVHPVLHPTMPEELDGIVTNVVFPTGIDRRNDIGMPNRFDVHYGMAAARIDMARLDLPDILSLDGVADSLDKKV
jgi:predicted GH43/DUF377 family glycosyl hydrolase